MNQIASNHKNEITIIDQQHIRFIFNDNSNNVMI